MLTMIDHRGLATGRFPMEFQLLWVQLSCVQLVDSYRHVPGKKRPFTLWWTNIAMENGPLIDGLPIKNGDFPLLCYVSLPEGKTFFPPDMFHWKLVLRSMARVSTLMARVETLAAKFQLGPTTTTAVAGDGYETWWHDETPWWKQQSRGEFLMTKQKSWGTCPEIKLLGFHLQQN